MRIVVVGAGILGASAAYHLARAGAEVVIVDAAHVGRATAAGAGIVCPWATQVEDEFWYGFYAAAARHYPEIVALLAEDGETTIGYRRVGGLVVHRDPGTLDRVERLVRRRAAEAPEAGRIARLDAAAARHLFPPLHPALGAVHIEGAARVDGRLITAALRRAAVKHGAGERDGQAELVASEGRVRGVRVGGAEIAADAVLVAAGAWARALLAPLGIGLAVEPQRGQITHLRVADPETRAWPVVLPLSGHYLLAFDDQRVVVGATRETGAGFDYRVTAGGQAEVLNQALAVAPGLADATLIETRIGFRPFGATLLPLLGRVAGLEGLVIGNGLGAGGLTMGPYSGRLLTDLLLGRAPAQDLTRFDPLRDPSPGDR